MAGIQNNIKLILLNYIFNLVISFSREDLSHIERTVIKNDTDNNFLSPNHIMCTESIDM